FYTWCSPRPPPSTLFPYTTLFRSWLKLPVLHPLPTFAQLAPLCSVTSLVQIGDAAVGDWKTPPQFSLTSLNEYVSDTKYLRSRSKLEAAAELIREDVDSPMETD